MRCHNINDMLSAYVDGALEPSELSKVEEHLERCQHCRREYEDLKAVLDLVQSLPEVHPEADFRKQLRQRLENLPANREKTGKPPGLLVSLARGRWSKIVAAAAALVLTVGLTTLWYGDIHHPGSGADPRASQVLPVKVGAVVEKSESTPKKSDVNNAKSEERTLDVRIDAQAQQKRVKINGEKDTGALLDNASNYIPAAKNIKEAPRYDVSRNKSAPLSALSNEVPAQDSSSFDTVHPAPGSYGIASVQPRKIVRRADLSIDVVDVKQTAYKIKNMIRDYGNVVFNEDVRESKSFITLQLPVDVYEDFIKRLEKEGSVLSQNITARDITEQYNDTQAALAGLQAEEQCLLSTANSAAADDTDKAVADELSRLRLAIKEKEEIIRKLESETNTITIVVDLK